MAMAHGYGPSQWLTNSKLTPKQKRKTTYTHVVFFKGASISPYSVDLWACPGPARGLPGARPVPTRGPPGGTRVNPASRM